MVTVNGIEYGTKDEAAQRCKEYAAQNPGTVFHNYAHFKCVRTADNRTTLYEWNKLYTDAAILKAHPELKGMWHAHSTYTNAQAQKGGR